MVGVADPALRYAAVRVIGRVFDEAGAGRADRRDGRRRDDHRAQRRRSRGQAAAMQTLGAMRYERAVQALTELFQYFGRGELAEAALDAMARIAHPASIARPDGAAGGEERGAARALRSKVSARIGDRSRRLASIEIGAGRRDQRRRAAGRVFAAAMLGNGPIDPIAEALTGAEAARSRRGSISSRWRRDASGAFARICRIRTRDRVEASSMCSGSSGDLAALPLVESLLSDRDPQVAARPSAPSRVYRRSGGPTSRQPRSSLSRRTLLGGLCVLGVQSCREASSSLLRPAHARRRPRSPRQGAGARPARRPHQRHHRRSRGVHRRDPIRRVTPRPGRRGATRRSTGRPATPTSI